MIIITGHGSLQSAMEGMRFGLAGYRLKPFNVSELINMIHQTFDKKTRLDLLRHALEQSQHLWNDTSSIEGIWTDMKAQYTDIAKENPTVQLPLRHSSTLTLFLSELVEAYNRDLFHHASRVSFYSTLVGNHLNFREDEQEALALGGLIHDIGYLGEGRPWNSIAEDLSHSEK